MTSEPRILPLPDSGAHLVIGADGRLRTRLRTGRFALVDAPPTELLDALERGVDGRSSSLDRLILEVQERESADSLRRWPEERRDVCLLGTDPLVGELERVLAAWGAQVTVADPASEPPEDAALVVAYAEDAPGRRRWSELDRLPGRGIAWLRVHREGEIVLIDPIALDPSDPTSVQVAARRVAASSAPASTEAWQQAGPLTPGPVDGATRVLVLARLLHVILAWAQGGAELDRLRTTLWKVVPASGSVSEHTVLPFPAAPRRVNR
ncbi:hypothetical protein [Microbacterium sp. MYb66]|uniref:hypothetical protein n=1 Tax=Microbacterium sp. MYb66 TaxID=1848692 RepID=UPI000CFEBA25|nr:hypothetical protein [Microbacterium sp. MYb66]PRA82460.1 hypothetical protein CQ045_07265 [Microbacterium sp. MYb66]